MRAAVTRAVGAMEVVELASRGARPGRGHRSQRGGGDLRLGLPLSARRALGGRGRRRVAVSEDPGTRGRGDDRGARSGLPPRPRTAARVALYPLHACGHCYPCSVGRPNTCDNFTLIGIHLDGGLQQRLCIPQQQVFPIATDDSAVAALAEPVSIAVRAVHRARIEAGEHVVVLGAGPIGQCVCLVARERGAEVLVVDLQERRLSLSREMGAEGLVWTDASAVVSAARGWAGAAGPPVVVDATGAAQAVRAMVEMVASAGRAVQVGMSNEEVPIRIGSLTEKELDLLGVSCCGGGEFAEAVAAVERNGEMLVRLISHEFPLERAPEAIEFAIEHPAEVMKVVIRVD